MKNESTDVSTVLTALHQAYYGMYALLIKRGTLERGELPDLLSDETLKHHIGESAAQWLSGMATILDQIDAGRTVELNVIDGGKKD